MRLRGSSFTGFLRKNVFGPLRHKSERWYKWPRSSHARKERAIPTVVLSRSEKATEFTFSWGRRQQRGASRRGAQQPKSGLRPVCCPLQPMITELEADSVIRELDRFFREQTAVSLLGKGRSYMGRFFLRVKVNAQRLKKLPMNLRQSKPFTHQF